MILVSGAGGKTGRAVIAALARRGQSVRAFVRRPQQIDGATDYFVGDMLDSAAWREALARVTKLYHICPNVHPDEVEIGRNAIHAAQHHTLSHLVYHSVLHPQTQKMPHHWRKMRVEEMLFECGLPITVLQPTAYMQNIQLANVLKTGVYAVPYPVETHISLVDLHDVAEVAARILTEAGHAGATYELVGSEPLTQIAVAAVLGERFDQKITAQQTPLDQWQQTARQNGLPDHAIDTLSAMFRYYAQWGLIGNRNVLSWLLEREPTTLSDYQPS